MWRALTIGVAAPAASRLVPGSPSGRLGLAAAGAAVAVASVDWAGWLAGIPALTRILPSWPGMMPWTALWLAALGAAILLQSGHPSKPRIWAGRGLAILVGAAAAFVLLEYATGRRLGVDTLWFRNAVTAVQPTWPGRPSPHTAASTLLLALPVALARWDRRRADTAWAVSLLVAMALPGIAVLAYVFDALNVVAFTTSTGMSLLTATGLLLLGIATLMVRPEHPPAAWLVSPTHGGSLTRLGIVLAGFPLLVGLSRRALGALGLATLAVTGLFIRRSRRARNP